MIELNATTRNWFSSPGESVRAVMLRRGITAMEIAGVLAGGMSTLKGILAGSASIDTQEAEALAAKLGGTPGFWLQRQIQYDGALASAVRLAAANEGDAWLEKVPVPNSKSTVSKNKIDSFDEIKRRMIFYHTSSYSSWLSRYGSISSAAKFRTTSAFESEASSVLFWLRRGELEADLVQTGRWNPDAILDRIDAIRNLTRISKPRRFLPKLRAICAESGIALVIERAPSGCRASGATKFVAPDKAMLLVSFRYRSDDQFWFTVFHELGHLILHSGHTFVDADDMPEDELEREANAFAEQCIVPEKRRSEFLRLSADRDSVTRFAVSIGVCPGLIVGQMQHSGMIEYRQLNSLKRRWTWDEIQESAIP